MKNFKFESLSAVGDGYFVMYLWASSFLNATDEV